MTPGDHTSHTTSPRVVRVVPDVVGLDKCFDYDATAFATDGIEVGAVVRVDLHGRRVAGWVVEVDPVDAFDGGVLSPLASVTGRGPSAELVALAAWAANRWAGRWRHFLKTASPSRVVRPRGADRRTGATIEPRSPASTELLASEGGGGVVRLPPTADALPAILSAVAIGPTLVVVPAASTASLMAARLRRSGLTVALMPHDWAVADAGVDVVIGTRAAAWAPCQGISAAVVIDEHDESLQEEGSPTWHARDVLIERCRRAGAALLLVSPSPTLAALEWGPLLHPSTDRERREWPQVEVVDRSDTEPWKRSLVTSQLIAELRDPERTVVCISNTTGRAKLLACRHCRALTRCERCEAAVELVDHGADAPARLSCRRCGFERPTVCLECGAGRFANLRPGIRQLRDELEAAAGRQVVLVQGSDTDTPTAATVYVGTEAALHRIDRADTVAFLDFDRELLAPRYRAAEQAMSLIVRAARLVGRRADGGRIMLQTFLPHHEVVVAARLAQPGRLVEPERERRQLLQLPPYAALAEVSGAGADEFVGSLPDDRSVQRVGGAGEYAVKAPDWESLGQYLAHGVRPSGARLRIAVDPPRA